MGLPPAWEAIFREKGMMPREPGHPSVIAAGLPARPNGTGKIKGAVACVGSVVADAESVTTTIALRTKNPTNNREPWWAVSKRAKAEHEAVKAALTPFDGLKPTFARGCRVTLTRVSYGRVDRHNLGATLKAVIDAVAMWTLGGTPGQFDEDDRLAWDLKQLKAGRGVFGVILSLRASHPRG